MNKEREALRQIVEIVQDHTISVMETYSRIDKVATEALQSESEWISVEDRLPEYGKYVLVVGTNRMQYDIKRHHVCEMNDLEDGIEFKENGQFYWLTESGRRIDKVTHWMPLPQAPKTPKI